ncbi:protein kinase [Aquimonas sp.]|jgi:serine/threonine-protein kinase|uniref:protein kinase domain-containing protein n=1 Tax=Aquimonas sp. TaxID=1872588 RepID=UPI0037C052D0
MSHSIDTERQALALFRKLLELDTGDRARLDAELAEAEPELAARVRRMLERHHSLTNRLERPWQQEMAQLGLPSQLGAFTLVRELGRGGMGIVAEGQREAEGFTQRVAIKWIPAWQVDAARRQRFLFERDVVARLRHPHIARLVDGGEGSEGELWYAMELVDGKDLLSHCRERGLGLRERVQLLLDLCDAVAHAHRHLILHRDIKTGNVLVDDEGQLKLIDFGIAKGLDSDSDDLTLDAAPMTPRYAAPEQLRGERPTTLSDLWQVAALAYELLSGQPARKDGGLRKASDATMESAVEHAVSCGLDSTRLKRALQGDLDALLERALSDKPEQRYANIEAFCDELRAWLSGRPVLARRHERWYAAKRFALQHRWSLGFASTALLAIISAGVIAVVLGGRARAEAEVADATSDLLTRMLLAVDGGTDAVALRSMNLRQFYGHVVDTAVAETGLPKIRQHEIIKQLAGRSLNVGALEAAERAARKQLELADAHFSAISLEAAQARDSLARISVYVRGRQAAVEAEQLLDQSSKIYDALAMTRTAPFMAHLRTRMEFEHSLWRPQQMLSAASSALDLALELYGEHSTEAVYYQQQLVNSYDVAGDSEKALDESIRALALAELAAAQNPDVAALLDWIRTSVCEIQSRSDPVKAKELCLQIIARLKAADRLMSFGGYEAMYALATTELALKDLDAALSAAKVGEQALISLGGDVLTSVDMARMQSLTGQIHLARREYDEAEQYLRPAFDSALARRGAAFPSVMRLRLQLASAVAQLGHREQALELLDSTLDVSLLTSEDQKGWHELVSQLQDPE